MSEQVKKHSKPKTQDLSKINVRYNGRNHAFQDVVALKSEKDKKTVPASMIAALNKPFEFLPSALQNDEVRLMKTRDTFYVISGFKKYVEQKKVSDVITAFVYTPKELTNIAAPELLKAEDKSAVAAKLARRFNVTVKS